MIFRIFSLLLTLFAFSFLFFGDNAHAFECQSGYVERPDGSGCDKIGGGDNILGISNDCLRNGCITMADIPMMIASAIEYILAITGTVCVVALIYHAVRMQFASGITGDSSGVDKAKKGIYGSLLGFVLAMSAWFLMSKLVAILAETTSGP